MGYLARRIALRNRVLQRRERQGRDAEFLFQHAAYNIVDKIKDLKKPLQNLLVINPRDRVLLEALQESEALDSIARVTFCEPSSLMREKLQRNIEKLQSEARAKLFVKKEINAADLPFDSLLAFFSIDWELAAPRASGVSLQRALASALEVLARLLDKGAPMFAISFAEGTLASLARTLVQAEARLRERVSMRIHPHPSIASAGDCLRDLQLLHPFVECEPIEVGYASVKELMLDLQLMGESSCLNATPLSRELLELAQSLYPKEERGEQKRRQQEKLQQAKRQQESRGIVAESQLLAEFNLLTMHAWTQD